jgi:hypothetical protein
MEEKDLPQSPEEAAANLLLHPFFELIGCLWWLVAISRVDLLVPVHNCSRWVSRPSEKLWSWLMRLLRYLKGTHDLGLVWRRPDTRKQGGGQDGGPLRFIPTSVRFLSGASDSSFADAPKMKTTLGGCMYFCNNLVDYFTKTSTRMCDSSTDAECCALVLVGHMNSWWRDFMVEIGLFSLSDPTPVKEDNTSAVALTGHGSAKRSRHFHISFYKLKDTVEFGDLELVQVGTKENEADFLTKGLSGAPFVKHRTTLMGAKQDYFSQQAAECGDAVVGRSPEPSVEPRALHMALEEMDPKKGPRVYTWHLAESISQMVTNLTMIEVTIPKAEFVSNLEQADAFYAYLGDKLKG